MKRKTLWFSPVLAVLCIGLALAGEPWIECEDDGDCDDGNSCTTDYCVNNHCYNDEDDCDSCCEKCDPETGYCEPVIGGACVWAFEYLAVNDDDDDLPFGADSSNAEIDGQADLADIATLTVSAPGWQEDCSSHSVTIEVTGDGIVRIFEAREVGAGFVLLSPASVELDLQDAPSWNLGIEGVAPGEITIHVTHRCGSEILGEDECTLIVFQAQLDVSRAFAAVDQDIEHSEGTITKVFTPGLDSDPTLWYRSLPTVNVLPNEIQQECDVYLRKRFLDDNQGVFRVLRDGVEILAPGQAEVLVPPASLGSGVWVIQALGTGSMDLYLEVEMAGQVVHCDQIRAFATLSPPAGGRNHVVNPNGLFDVGTFTAYPTITGALAAAGPNENVIVTRATYNERGLTVGSQVRVLGLGGAIDTQLEHRLVPTGMPVVNAAGGTPNAVFIVTSLDTIGPTISGLEITGGRSAEGGGIRIKDCSLAVTVEYNHIRNNNAVWSGPAYGGGMFAENSDALIRYNIVESNSAGSAMGGGGGIFFRNARDAVIESNHIIDNSGHYGGGIGVQGTTSKIMLTIETNLIEGNSAGIVGGGIGVAGDYDDTDALIASWWWEGIPGSLGGHPTVVEDNDIRGNTIPSTTSEERGGGLYAGAHNSDIVLSHNRITENAVGGDGGGVCIFNLASVNASGNQINQNAAGDDAGGVNHGTYSSGVWIDNEIAENTAVSNGGGIHCSVSSRIELKDSCIQGNRTLNLDGGGISLRNSRLLSHGGNLIQGNSAARHGGGIRFKRTNDLTPTPIQTGVYLKTGDIIRNNTAGATGGAVYCVDEMGDAQVDIKDIAIVGNTGAAIVTGCFTDGVYLRGFGAWRLYVGHCDIFDHRGAGLTCQACFDTDMFTWQGSIDGNTFQNNGTGLNISQTVANVTGNTFINNTLYGVLIEESYRLDIVKNTFWPGGVRGRGVQIDHSDYVRVISINDNNFVGFTGPNQFAVFVVIPKRDFFGTWIFIDAEDNWWGHAMGPHDPPPTCTDASCNVNPPGDRVNDTVDYNPWSVAPN